MKLAILSAAVLAASLAAGTAAFAQSGDQSDATASVNNTSNTDAGVLQDQAKMAPFFTDDTMATLRSDAEVRTAYDAMASADQEQMKQNCIDMSSGSMQADQSQSLQDLCKMVQAY